MSFSISHLGALPAHTGLSQAESPNTSASASSALSPTQWKILDTVAADPKGMSFDRLLQLMPQIGEGALRDAVCACLERELLGGDVKHFSCTDEGLTALVENVAMDLPGLGIEADVTDYSDDGTGHIIG